MIEIVEIHWLVLLSKTCLYKHTNNVIAIVIYWALLQWQVGWWYINFDRFVLFSLAYGPMNNCSYFTEASEA